MSEKVQHITFYFAWFSSQFKRKRQPFGCDNKWYFELGSTFLLRPSDPTNGKRYLALFKWQLFRHQSWPSVSSISLSLSPTQLANMFRHFYRACRRIIREFIHAAGWKITQFFGEQGRSLVAEIGRERSCRIMKFHKHQAYTLRKKISEQDNNFYRPSFKGIQATEPEN